MKGFLVSFLPLMCLDACGAFYGPYPWGYPYPFPKNAVGRRIFQHMPTPFGIRVYTRAYFKPYQPRTPAQVAHRQKWADGVSRWHNLNYYEKKILDNYKKPEAMSGFDRFIHYYFKGSCK